MNILYGRGIQKRTPGTHIYAKATLRLPTREGVARNQATVYRSYQFLLSWLKM